MRTPAFVAPPSATVATPDVTFAGAPVAAQTAPVAGAAVAPSDERLPGSQRDLVRSVGLAAVFLSAALLSFDTLNRLALAVGWTGSWSVADFDLRLSWLLPVAIDCYAWLTVREWLRGSSGARRTRYAARSARVALGLTMAANALFHAFEALHWNLSDNAVAAIVVGAIPPFLAERVAVMFTLGGNRSTDAGPAPDAHRDRVLAQRSFPSSGYTRDETATNVAPLSAELWNAVALVVPLVEASAPIVPSQRQVREHLKRHGIRIGFPKVKLVIADAELIARQGCMSELSRIQGTSSTPS